MSQKSSRTEQPTPKRLLDAQRKGNVARTNDLSSALIVLGTVLYYSFLGPEWLERLKQLSSEYFSAPEHFREALTPSGFEIITAHTLSAGAPLLLFPILGVAAFSIAGNVVQAPPSFSAEPLKLDFSKLNPLKGLSKLFKVKMLVDLSKALFKVALITLIGAMFIQRILNGDYEAPTSAIGLFFAAASIGKQFFLQVGILMLVLAAADILFTRWNHARGLRMSKQEIKDERKQADGDPLIKQRVRQRQTQLARSRMMADVATANVVITNPTHFAVALKYDQLGHGVPQVVAKGSDHMARRIREVAAENDVPIHSDPPLARSLFRSVEVGDFIPDALFHAVAEVLALVMGRRRAI